MVAVGANLAYQTVSLLFETPVSWDFHFLLFLSSLYSIPCASQRLSGLDFANLPGAIPFRSNNEAGSRQDQEKEGQSRPASRVRGGADNFPQSQIRVDRDPG